MNMRVEWYEVKKSGFTLIELLAAIIVLAIVLTVAVPAITGLINSSKTSAFKVDANMLLKTIESKIAGLEEYDVSIITVDNMESEIGIANDNYKSLAVSIVDGKINIDVVGQNKWVGYRATGTYNNITVIGNGVAPTTAVAEALVVAGGGGGGTFGGGGAGGVIHNSSYTVSLAQTYNIVVGNGGTAGLSGSNSSFDTIVATGGGAGGLSERTGLIGGSGGGGGSNASVGQYFAGGNGTVDQGHNGGATGGYSCSPCGGGGGAGAAGADSTSSGSGVGGIGLMFSISGTDKYYGGGGGGGSYCSSNSVGGSGGGGTGSVQGTGSNGTPNTGGGGGGGTTGGAGGSGIVIIRYLTGDISATGGTVTVDGDYTIHTFTTDGEFTVE